MSLSIEIPFPCFSKRSGIQFYFPPTIHSHMKEEKSTQEDKIHKRILKAWQKEFGDIKQSSEILYAHLAKRFDKSKDPPSREEVRKALKDLKEIPKIAPLIAIILSSPIPGSSVGYLVLVSVLKKMSKDRINLVPKNFEGIINRPSSKDEPGENDKIS